MDYIVTSSTDVALRQLMEIYAFTSWHFHFTSCFIPCSLSKIKMFGQSNMSDRFCNRVQGPVLIYDKTSYWKILQNFEAARFACIVLEFHRHLGSWDGSAYDFQWYGNSNHQARGFDTSRDLTIRHITIKRDLGDWNTAMCSAVVKLNADTCLSAFIWTLIYLIRCHMLSLIKYIHMVRCIRNLL